MTNQNTGRGLLVAVLALIFLVQAPGYGIGSFSAPGAGLFPTVVASALLIVGSIILLRARFVDVVPLNFHVRNIALIAASLVGFALISEYVNMFVGIASMATVGSLASNDFSIRRTVSVVIVLCLFAITLRNGLGLQLPLY